MKLHFFLLAALPVLLTAQAHASAPDRLKAFVDNLTTFQAGFVQTLYDADSQPIQESKGAGNFEAPEQISLGLPQTLCPIDCRQRRKIVGLRC